MELLIIGGTRFVGRAIVDAAIARGHTLTLFNRGQSNPDLYPDIERIAGNRDGGLAALDGRSWDAVIDTCGYVPRLVEASARYLARAVGHYTFISTISVYTDALPPHSDENGPLATVDDPTTEEVTGGTYGGLKVLCEDVATHEMNGRALLVRPGLVVGPHDHTDRFSYWPHRLARGGEVLAPGVPGRGTQFIDARDLAEWVVVATEQRLTGPYNAVGPADTLTMSAFLDACRKVAGTEATFTWVSDDFLNAHELRSLLDMPQWVSAEDAAFLSVDNRKAIAAGLKFRPPAATITATLDWLRTRPADYAWRAGLSAEREAELLAEWHAAGH